MKIIFKTILIIFFLITMNSCDSDGIIPQDNNEIDTGILQVSITDAPIDASNIKSVWIKIDEIEYQFNNEWQSTGPLLTPLTVDLLTLTNGTTIDLLVIPLEVGSYNNIRFILDIDDEGLETTDPGCFIQFLDSSTTPLFVPSGDQSGYKAQGSFNITDNGITNITVDFNLRKMIVKKGNGDYLLRPVLRMVNNSDVGAITVPVDDGLGYNNIIVYAYNDGEYVEIESADPAEEEVRFPNSITCIDADLEGNYVLPFLPEGTYDLVIVGYNDDVFIEIIRIIEDVIVLAGEETNINTYTITYNANTPTSGTAPSNQTKLDGTDLTLSTNTGILTKSGFTFAGWNTAADGSGTDYEVGAFYTIDANMTLYAKWNIIYSIGDTGPAGGIIIYDDEADGIDDLSDIRYIEVAPYGWHLDGDDPAMIWGNDDIYINNTTKNIGSGMINTENIISVLGDGDYAASICYNKNINGYTDWFLPSEQELVLIHQNLFINNLGKLTPGSYWSSSEVITMSARSIRFFDGVMNGDYSSTAKSSDQPRVRPIRYF